MSGLDVKIADEERGNHTVLRIAGTLALGDTTRALQEHFEKLASERPSPVIRELSEPEPLDSTAIRGLLGAVASFVAAPLARVGAGLRPQFPPALALC